MTSRVLRAFALVVLLFGGGLAAGLLVPRGGRDHDHAEAADLYVCPMHPAVTSTDPNAKCPLCGMRLVKQAPAKPRAARPSEVEGLAAVELDPGRQQLIGLKTARVERGVVIDSLRTVARVGVDETRVRRVNVKVSGFIEKLYVDFVGKAVRRGQPLFSLYSPELLGAESEYLLALGTGNAALASAARRKLSLWDVPDAELERLERERTPSSVVTFLSEVSGVVTKKDIVEGSRVELGAMPYEVVDLSSVWVLADLYETELRSVRPGMNATLRLDAWPGRTWQGKVLFIDPVLDGKTRTAKVRLAFSNEQGELKPEMYGDVTLEREGQETVRVPTDAVVPTGTESVVFVSLGEGRFEPRRVALGARGKDFSEVLSGLAVGEAVVTRANFLVDSESRLRASLARFGSRDASTPGDHEAKR
jgi:Cu(I)/Ag(I) efflux system membrane fusion protein